MRSREIRRLKKHDGNRKKESIFSKEKLREYNYSIIGIVWLSNCIKTRVTIINNLHAHIASN